MVAAGRDECDAQLVPGVQGHRPAAGAYGSSARLAAEGLPEGRSADARDLGDERFGAAPGPARRARGAGRRFAYRALTGRRPFRAVGGAGRSGGGARALPCRGRHRYCPGMTQVRSRSRSAARLAAVQALYQQEMEGTPMARLLHEFHDHRLGATIENQQYHEAERDFFDDIVTGVDARRSDIDQLIAARLAEGWVIERLDRPMRAILRAGTYELLARPDVPVASAITEYVDVAHAFYD